MTPSQPPHVWQAPGFIDLAGSIVVIELIGGALIGLLYGVMWSVAVWISAVVRGEALSAFPEVLGIAASLGIIGLAIGTGIGCTVGLIAAGPGALLLNRRGLNDQPLVAVARSARFIGAPICAGALVVAYFLMDPLLPIYHLFLPVFWLLPCTFAVAYTSFAFGRFVMRTEGPAHSEAAAVHDGSEQMAQLEGEQG